MPRSRRSVKPSAMPADTAAANPGGAHDRTAVFPGGLRARWRWAGSGRAAEAFALTEAGGPLEDHGTLGAADPDAACRAELRVDGPGGAWTARFASLINDPPSALLWDDAGQLVVGYGFVAYGLDHRSGTVAWHLRSATPLVAILASPRLGHIIVQAELETFAVEPGGRIAWRLSHSDVVTGAGLLAGRLVLESYAGQHVSLDAATGR